MCIQPGSATPPRVTDNQPEPSGGEPGSPEKMANYRATADRTQAVSLRHVYSLATGGCSRGAHDDQAGGMLDRPRLDSSSSKAYCGVNRECTNEGGATASRLAARRECRRAAAGEPARSITAAWGGPSSPRLRRASAVAPPVPVLRAVIRLLCHSRPPCHALPARHPRWTETRAGRRRCRSRYIRSRCRSRRV